MANRTDKEAASVHGTNPQNLVEYIIRQKIYDSLYWKQECFGLSAERIVDKAVNLRFAGGMYGEPQKPTEFICLLLKMLQIQPDKEIIIEFIKNDDFKYLRLLGAVYMRLVGRAIDIFNYLEPLLNDYRRVRIRQRSGGFALSHIDEVIDELLRSDYLFDIALPHLPSRRTLEKIGQLEMRTSALDDEFQELLVEKKRQEAAEGAAQDKNRLLAASSQVHRPLDADRREYRPTMREKWRLGPSDHRNSTRRSRSRSTSRDRHRRHAEYRDERRGRVDYSRRQYDRPRSRSRERKRPRETADMEERDGGPPSGSKDSLTIEQANALRASLGLAPLK